MPHVPPLNLPGTEQLLTEGGDARIMLDPSSGLNKYGCPPHPDPQLIAFGSSTASVISESGFAAANQLRNSLITQRQNDSEAVIYTRELQRVRDELSQLCGLTDLPDINITFASSGTDLHLIAAQYVSACTPFPLLAIMVDAAETGSSVSAALSGRHFSNRSSLGKPTHEGSTIQGSGNIEIANIAIRLTDGSPRLTSEVDAEVTALAENAAARGQHILLVLIDQSKTGLIAPSPACAAALKRQLPHTLAVLVDACQFRISPSTLRAYLAQDFMVALTGSKFVGGPTFSAALMIPPSTAKRLQKLPFPPALSAYSLRAEWPAIWAAANGLEQRANFGLLLRWEAALQAMRAFYAIPQASAVDFINAFSATLHQYLTSDPHFEPFPAHKLERGPMIASDNWDRLPTIFPFLLFHTKNQHKTKALSLKETHWVYQALQRDEMQQPAALRFQLGQPVACGLRNGMPVNALRICISAQMIVDATSNQGQGATIIIKRALGALTRAAQLTNSLDASNQP